MSDETSENSYSAFWPVLVVVVALGIGYCYQIVGVLQQRSIINQRYDATATPDNLQKAKAAQDHLLALWNDLKSTAAKDTNAAQIVREANQSGLIRDRGTPGDTNAAPAAASGPATP